MKLSKNRILGLYLILAIFISIGPITPKKTYGMDINYTAIEKQHNLRTIKKRSIAFILLSSMFYAYETSWLCSNELKSIKTNNIDLLKHSEINQLVLPEIIRSKTEEVITKQNEIWNEHNITIFNNGNMPTYYLNQIDKERYMPVISPQLTDQLGVVGKGRHGIAFLVIDKDSKELNIAKIPKQELEESKKERSIKHMREEVNFSKKWESITKNSLKVRLVGNVIYKKFVYGKQLAYWLKSGLIFTDIDERQKLFDFYENMFSQHKQVMDLQYENLVFDEINKEWVIIDGGGVLEFDTLEETLDVYLKNYRDKYTHNIKFNGDEVKKKQYYDDINQLAHEIKSYCMNKTLNNKESQ